MSDNNNDSIWDDPVRLKKILDERDARFQTDHDNYLKSIKVYPHQDQIDLLKIFKTVHSTPEMLDRLHHYYKKYIDANAPYPSTTCNCSSNAVVYFNTLRDWYSENGRKFKDE